MLIETRHPDQIVIDIYNKVGEYRDFCKHVAEEMSSFGAKVQAVALMQAINPYYPERPFFFMRGLWFLIGWIRRRPRSGMWLLHASVRYVLHHAAPNGNVKDQISVLETQVKEVSARVDEVQAAIDAIPQVRLECREYVRKRRTKQSGRLKQPGL